MSADVAPEARVGVVAVSHVAALADGVRQLAAQMAPDVPIGAAGGTDDGGVGTSFDLITQAVTEADQGAGVVVLYDLGSAQMTAELVAETVEDVHLVDAPLVEGTLAAAVAAQGGADLAAVEAAARSVVPAPAEAAPREAAPREGAAEPVEQPSDRVTARAVLRNPLGLHARPAAELARRVAAFDAKVTVGRPGTAGTDASSAVAVVAQGMRGQDEVEITASGAEARQAVDAVVAMIEEGFGEIEADVLRGVAASPGTAIGPVRQLRRPAPVLPERASSDPGTERRRLEEAYERVDAELVRRGTDIAAAHRAFLADPALRAEADRRIAEGASAEAAWWETTRAAGQQLAGADELAAERAIDLEDLGLAVLTELGVELPEARLPENVRGAVVVADDLLPSQVGALVEAGVEGVALAGGGRTSHAAIIARGLELPMVVRLGEAVLAVPEGTPVLLDAEGGVLRVDPPEDVLRAARGHASRVAAEREEARRQASARVEGIEVAANVGSLTEAQAAVANGADGLGLVRTELLFVDRPTVPNEEEQRAELAAILDVVGDRPVTIRTLDIGGDKLLPAFDLDPIRNGPLGSRGLRYGLEHPDLLRTQVRAILRAAYGRTTPVSVMAPMVTRPDEAAEFRRLVEEIAAEPECAVPAGIGVMVEVPAAALDADELCRVVDFVSVGSNDLTQYLMAADRTLDVVAHLYASDHPAVWACISALVASARPAGCRVAVCGELAADPDAAVRLVRLGVQEVSMAPSSIPAVKAALRSR